ncbi:MAG: RibD family protein [Candidatus Marinimicrobia bacterium]|nr:RibD family protein [Candidatus Neomarinimicrobiota bacterium]
MSHGIKVLAVFATSLDGRLGPADVSRFVRISSDADMEHLMRVRDLADAVLMGAATFRHYPKPHAGLERDDFPVHCIMTRRGELDFSASLFQQSPPLPVTIFSSANAPDHLPEKVNWLSVPELENSDGRGISEILAHLQNQGIKTLLVEGGGQVFRQFLAARAVDELYLTLVPHFIGGETSPRLTGFGAALPQPFPRTTTLESWAIGNERYYHLAIHYDG